MPIQILKIDRSLLMQIEPLLVASAGYQISMADELDYFESQRPDSWFVATDDNEVPIGFVRSFSHDEWSQAELFVSSTSDRRSVATELLENFLKAHVFNSGHRLRFDVAISDVELKDCIEHFGLNEKSQTFFYYELNLTERSGDYKIQNADVSALEVAEALSNLHPVHIDEVRNWIQNNSIRTVEHEGKVVAAAHIIEFGNVAEISRIATHSKFLRRGYSRTLMQNFSHELSQRGIKKLFLKVESTRAPAIRFYENFGFERNESKTQAWFSKYF